MDNQSIENSCANNCSNGKVLKILVLVVIALQLIGFGLSANFFTSIINYVGAVPVSSVVPVREEVAEVADDAASTPIYGYSNSEYGFAFSVPQAWSEVGLLIKKEGGSNGQQAVFNYYLTAEGDNSLFKVSSIGVYPVTMYVKDQCAEEGPCVPGVEVGRNSQYVFVSESFSPEAFEVCYETGAEKFGGEFYESNKSLCELGATQRQTERSEGNFSAF